jgi:translation initiation factor 6 (eIF-6)
VSSVQKEIAALDQLGTAAVVTCKGKFEGPQFSGTLKFMRVWLKKRDRWRIIAGSISN